MTYVVVSREEYADKSWYHFHAVVVCERVRHFRKPTYADINITKNGKAFKKHGNYASAKYLQKAVEYAKKDGDFIEFGTLHIADKNTDNSKKPKKSDTIAQLLMQGGTVAQVNEVDPGYLMVNLNKILEYSQWLEMNNLQQRKLFPLLVRSMEVEQLSAPELQIFDWILHNITDGETLGLSRPLRKKQLWIYGTFAVGKTTFVQKLHEYLRIFIPIYNTDFLDGYQDSSYDLIVFDEYKGQKPITFLNSFIDGSFQRYNVKNRHTIKRRNLPCIFLSNYSPDQVYSKLPDSDPSKLAFIDRLEVVEIGNLFKLLDAMELAEQKLKETEGAGTEVSVIQSPAQDASL